ncbi:hypothetical protein SSPIM334S_01941 [Streptomyces spiroverticillatus]
MEFLQTGWACEISCAQVSVVPSVTQTAYAHFGSREALLAAVRDEVSRRAVAVLDAADTGSGPAVDALGRFLDAAAELMMHQAVSIRVDPGTDEQGEAARHRPVEERLEALIRRGRATGEFRTDLETGWLIAATIALGHAADARIRSGHLGARAATEQYRASVMRLYGATEPDAGR